MNKNNMRKLLSFILCVVLIAAMALLATGCTDNKKETPKTPDTTQATTSTDATKATSEGSNTDVTTKGEGKTSFNFEVTDLDGKTTKFLIKTDKKTVGNALLELGLIKESTQSAGMIVVVNGISADYNKDGAWWAYYINGESANEGVLTTKIDTTATYSFVKTPA